MSTATAGWLQVGLLVAAIAVCYVPLGNYMAHIFTVDKDWRIERGVYKLIGVNPKADQKWSVYVRSILAFSAVSVLFLYGLERLQHYLLLSEHMANVPPDTAWNTAASFVTNTNWQNYAGESTMGYLVQMTGLTVQQFMSAAVGLVVAIAMIRGFVRSRTDKLGNFWVDVTRASFRLLIPIAVVVGSSSSPTARSRTCTPTRPSPRSPARTRPSPAARWARWKRSRTRGTTAEGSSTPTPPTRSRTPTRGRTGWRSSSCW